MITAAGCYNKLMRIIGIDPGTGILGFGVIDAKQGGYRLGDGWSGWRRFLMA